MSEQKLRTPALPNSKTFRDEIAKLRCALADIEVLAETLMEEREMATKALTGTDTWHDAARTGAGRCGSVLDWSRPSVWPSDRAGMEKRARELFERAKQANDPDMRDILSAAAWYYADKAEIAGP